MTKSLPTEKCSSLCAPGEPGAISETGQCQEKPQPVAWMTSDYNGKPMEMDTLENAQRRAEYWKAEPPLDCRVMPLCWGQIMIVYLEFDRNADKTWTDTEYLLRFGEAVSEATVGVIARQALEPHNIQIEGRD